MLSLQPISYEAIKPWLEDFCLKAKNREDLPSNAELLGICLDSTLVGYFIVTGYPDADLEINQGYLSIEARHIDLSKQAMNLLEAKAKASGYKRILLASSRTLKAYTKFMAAMDFKPSRIIFSKEI